MIATILARLGVPRWVAITALCILVAAGALAYRSHLIGQGISLEAARRDAIDAENDRRARAELADANARTRNAQAKLDGAMVSLSKLQTEFANEQAKSAALQSDLADGRRRLSVLTLARAADPAGQGESSSAAGVDPGASVIADLDGRVASDLEWARQTRNEAIKRLDGCIAAYDAVKTAADTQ
ncbi:hypothetical protein [Massilia sp. TN1-12]|uniref:hypothetical protein n=1 Tax=Massilia paldalensis TaxID=3377675 RepID=UPI00384B3BEF